MKRIMHIGVAGLAAAFFLSTGLLAQDQVEVSVKVKKDGRVVKDTTYVFEDESEAENAIRTMEVVSGEDEHMEHISYNYTSALTGSGDAKKMVFISEDGKHTEITEFSGDSVVWVSEDGNTFDVFVDEEDDGGDVARKKEIKVIVIKEDVEDDVDHEMGTDIEKDIEVRVKKKK